MKMFADRRKGNTEVLLANTKLLWEIQKYCEQMQNCVNKHKGECKSTACECKVLQTNIKGIAEVLRTCVNLFGGMQKFCE